MAIVDTKNLPNHFLTLKIHNRWSLEQDETLNTDTANMVFNLFLDCCNFKGLQQARLQLTPDWRKKLAPILAKHKAKWWKPDKVIAQRALAIADIVNPKPIPKTYKKFFNGLKWYCNSL